MSRKTTEAKKRHPVDSHDDDQSSDFDEVNRQRKKVYESVRRLEVIEKKESFVLNEDDFINFQDFLQIRKTDKDIDAITELEPNTECTDVLIDGNYINDLYPFLKPISWAPKILMNNPESIRIAFPTLYKNLPPGRFSVNRIVQRLIEEHENEKLASVLFTISSDSEKYAKHDWLFVAVRHCNIFAVNNLVRLKMGLYAVHEEKNILEYASRYESEVGRIGAEMYDVIREGYKGY